MSTTAKSHGMDGSMVDPDWPPLTFDEVRWLLGQFAECGEPYEILSVSPRPFSAASVVATEGARVFIKRHHRSVRDAAGLLEEHSFLTHLGARGAPVPCVLAATSGATVVENGEWTYEVHEAPQAVDLYIDAISWTPFQCAQHAHSAGQALARLHLASQGFQAPHRKPRPLVAGFTIFAAQNAGAGMHAYLGARPALRNDPDAHSGSDLALGLLAPFHVELLTLLPYLPPIWTHNDLHASNLLWSHAGLDAKATSIIDFGLADRTNAVHDLAQAIERNIVEWLGLVQDPAREDVPIHFDHLQALLNGYESVRPLSSREAEALAPMTALCHTEFALSEADYYLGVLHSPERARMASVDYLVGHAKWFRSRRGQTLLNALRAWAKLRDSPRQEIGNL